MARAHREARAPPLLPSALPLGMRRPLSADLRSRLWAGPARATPPPDPGVAGGGAAIGTLAADEKAFTAAARLCGRTAASRRRGSSPTPGFDGFCFGSLRVVLQLAVCVRVPAAVPAVPARAARVRDRGDAPVRAGGGQALRGPDALERLSAAATRQDAERLRPREGVRFRALLHPVLSLGVLLRCRRFCFCVCPPRTIGVFTKIGGLFYEAKSTATRRATGSPWRTAAPSSTPSSQWRPLRRRWSPPGRVPLRDGAISADGSTLADGKPILPSSWVPVTPAQIARRTSARSSGPIPGPPFLEVIEVWVNKSGPGIFTITPSADGWIEVPPMFPVAPMVPGSGWRFVPGSDLIARHDHAQALRRSIDETGVNAGELPMRRCRPTCTTGPHADPRSGRKRRWHRGGNLLAHRDQQHALQPHLPSPVLAGRPVRRRQRARCRLDRDRGARLDTVFCAHRWPYGRVHGRPLQPRAGQRWLQGPGGPYAFDLNPATAENPGENWFGTATPRWSARPRPRHGPSNRCRPAHTCSSSPSACC